jgi:hypothetical protein
MKIIHGRQLNDGNHLLLISWLAQEGKEREGR